MDQQPTLEQQPMPNPMHDVRKIPPDDLALVLNSIINESLLGFSRTLDSSGAWLWTCTGENGEKRTEMFDLVHDDLLAFDMLNRFCSQQRPQALGSQVNSIPFIEGKNEGPSWSVYILQPDPKGNPTTRAHVNANHLGVAIALALCVVVDANLPMQHRLLFPGKYLAIAH
jgi:hypothetical protein